MRRRAKQAVGMQIPLSCIDERCVADSPAFSRLAQLPSW